MGQLALVWKADLWALSPLKLCYNLNIGEYMHTMTAFLSERCTRNIDIFVGVAYWMRGRWEAERATLREDWGKGAGKGSKQMWKATWRQRCVSDDMFRHNSVFLPGHIWERVHERIAKPFGVLGVCVCVCVCVCRGYKERDSMWVRKKEERLRENTFWTLPLCSVASIRWIFRPALLF